MRRAITYPEAICEATHQAMERDDSVVLLGLGVDDPKAILGTTKGLAEAFGAERVFDTPLAEEGMTGIALGMAQAGLRPIHVHIRMDFLMLAMNQLVNMAAKKHYMTGGQEHIPMVVRSIIGKSWGQGAQHSQALYSLFMHVPGIKVVAPTTPHDAKGCLTHAVEDDNPVLFVEHKILYGPGKAANAGGVAVSGLEMAQNSMRYSWTREEVDQRLQVIMQSIHSACVAAADRFGTPGNYVNGANIAGFLKVADSMIDQGVV